MAPLAAARSTKQNSAIESPVKPNDARLQYCENASAYVSSERAATDASVAFFVSDLQSPSKPASALNPASLTISAASVAGASARAQVSPAPSPRVASVSIAATTPAISVSKVTSVGVVAIFAAARKACISTILRCSANDQPCLCATETPKPIPKSCGPATGTLPIFAFSLKIPVESASASPRLSHQSHALNPAAPWYGPHHVGFRVTSSLYRNELAHCSFGISPTSVTAALKVSKISSGNLLASTSVAAKSDSRSSTPALTSLNFISECESRRRA
mmetsp:Transcript_4196/g.15401  ORF Transcript_4196/g.15401 Transcript_4196/m.15401 type:complete len:275 (+) Transcript_4196:421-1245(+)